MSTLEDRIIDSLNNSTEVFTDLLILLDEITTILIDSDTNIKSRSDLLIENPIILQSINETINETIDIIIEAQFEKKTTEIVENISQIHKVLKNPSSNIKNKSDNLSLFLTNLNHINHIIEILKTKINLINTAIQNINDTSLKEQILEAYKMINQASTLASSLIINTDTQLKELNLTKSPDVAQTYSGNTTYSFNPAVSGLFTPPAMAAAMPAPAMPAAMPAPAMPAAMAAAIPAPAMPAAMAAAIPVPAMAVVNTTTINDLGINPIPDIQKGQPNYFNANIDNPDIEKIFFLSDIHGDMYGFIINLRDNAKVIRKKAGFVFNQDLLDQDLERQMNVNLNDLCIKNTSNPDERLHPDVHEYSYMDSNNSMVNYSDDMNYEWIGGNSHIVIIGDIIDNFRGVELDGGKIDGEHIHEEIKLIRFINAIDDLAKASNGRVIKLFGNHDYMGIFRPTGYKQNMSPYSLMPENNLHNINRLRYFESQEGMNLLKYNGMGIILKINNYLCVHAAFTGFDDLMFNGRVNNIQLLNDVILNLLFNNDKENLTKYAYFILGPNGLLFNRDYGEHKIISDKYKNNIMDKECSTIIIPKIQMACAPGDLRCINTIKLVIGHCIQGNMILNYSRSDDLFINQGFKSSSFDEISQTQTLVPELKPQTGKENYHYGMSMSCTSDSPVSPDPRLLRVDVAVSRGFDDIPWYISPERNDKEIYDYFKSKLPQIIEVDSRINPNNIQLKRTTIKNMLIHQPRSILDDTEYNVLKERLLINSNMRKELAGGTLRYKLNIH